MEAVYEHARLTGLNILSVLSAHLGDLARVNRFVKLQGFVNATEDFDDHPRLINGCSDFLVEVFGERGIHARTSIGVASLPNNITVEIEAIVEILSERKAMDNGSDLTEAKRNQTIRERLGLRPIINVSGTMTALGDR